MGPRASAAMILIQLFQDTPASALQVTVSISDKTSYRKISWSLEASRLLF